jgi:hypothetical protein
MAGKGGSTNLEKEQVDWYIWLLFWVSVSGFDAIAQIGAVRLSPYRCLGWRRRRWSTGLIFSTG